MATLPDRCEAPGCANKPHSRWKGGLALCQAHWQRMYKHGDLRGRPPKLLPPMPPCAIDGCEKRCRSRNSKYCEKHYYRRRRGADPAVDPKYKCRVKTISGYAVLTGATTHPLYDKGRLYEHRKVAYDKHGEVCPPCFWCGKHLEWKTAVVDHLNEVKDDNRPDNLVVSCNGCNRARGAMVPFIRRLQQDKLEKLVETFSLMRKPVSHSL